MYSRVTVLSVLLRKSKKMGIKGRNEMKSKKRRADLESVFC